MSERERSRRSRRGLVLAGGVAFLVLALAYCTGATRCAPTRAEHVADQRAAADRIRIAAAHTCEAGFYRDCLRLYEEARRFDPPGDVAPEVQRDRAAAMAAMDAGPGVNTER